MKRLKAISLRAKITILSAIVLVAIAGGLTLASNYNLDRFFVHDLQEAQMQSVTLDIDDTVLYDDTAAAVEFTPPSLPRPDDISVRGHEGATAYFIATVRRKSFVNSGLLIMALLALLGITAIFFLTGRALRPVRSLAAAMGKIDGNNLSARVVTDGASREIALLAGSYNHMLERLERAFTQQKNFSAAAAHELKTPLACMRTNLEVLQLDETPTVEEFRDAVAVASRNTNRLIGLVEELLVMNAAEKPEDSEPVALEHLFEDILNELIPVISEKELNISVEGDGFVWGDYALLYRAFYNLIENAVKYNVRRGHIRITTKPEDDMVKITVSDTGIGIPAEETEYIFDAFYRVDQSRSRDIGGCGLGLAIVKTIVEKQEGRIYVSSNKSGGSVFTVLLPAAGEGRQ